MMSAGLGALSGGEACLGGCGSSSVRPSLGASLGSSLSSAQFCCLLRHRAAVCSSCSSTLSGRESQQCPASLFSRTPASQTLAGGFGRASARLPDVPRDKEVPCVAGGRIPGRGRCAHALSEPGRLVRAWGHHVWGPEPRERLLAPQRAQCSDLRGARQRGIRLTAAEARRGLERSLTKPGERRKETVSLSSQPRLDGA